MKPTMLQTHHPVLSIILWLNSFLMYIFSVEMINDFYIWGFRLLSIISLILIIGVNWKKGIDGLKDLFHLAKTKKKKNGKH
jgi:hypothetical protein